MIISNTFIANIVGKLKGDSLKAKCARSSGILGLGTVADKGLAFVSKMILVRLLLPEEMGLMVLILSLTAMFEVFTEVGIKQSIIQHKNGATPGYLNMAWWFQSVRASCLYVIAFLVAPLVCKFYFAGKAEVLDNHTYQELFLLVRLAFLSILFNGFISPRAHVLEREFKFGKSVLIIQGSAIIGTAVTIVLALIYRNVWAMVIGFASMAMLRCLLSFVLCPFMPRFEFDKDSFRELLRFAKGVLGLPILAYLAFNMDVLVAGKMVSTDLLGMYGMAYVLARLPRELFCRIIGPVLLPAFAEKQDDNEALCNAVLKITKVVALFAIPSTVLAIMCSRTLLSLIFGTEYSSVAVPFGLLCIYILLLVQGTTFAGIFFGIGQPGMHRIFVGLRTLILGASIYPAIKLFGIAGAAGAVLLASIFATCLQVVVIHKTIGLKISDYVISWIPGFAMGLPVLVIIWLLQYCRPGLLVQNLAIGIFSCITVSLAGVLLFRCFE